MIDVYISDFGCHEVDMTGRFVPKAITKKRILCEFDTLDFGNPEAFEPMLDAALNQVYTDFDTLGILPNKMVLCDVLRNLNAEDASFIVSVITEMKHDPFMRKRHTWAYGLLAVAVGIALLGAAFLVAWNHGFEFNNPEVFPEKASIATSVALTDSGTKPTQEYLHSSPTSDTSKIDSTKPAEKDTTGKSDTSEKMPEPAQERVPDSHVHNWIPVTETRWIDDGEVWVVDAEAWTESVPSESYQCLCGVSFSSYDAWVAHNDSVLSAGGEPHGCSVVKGYLTVDHPEEGHYESSGHYEDVVTEFYCDICDARM